MGQSQADWYANVKATEDVSLTREHDLLSKGRGNPALHLFIRAGVAGAAGVAAAVDSVLDDVEWAGADDTPVTNPTGAEGAKVGAAIDREMPTAEAAKWDNFSVADKRLAVVALYHAAADRA